MDRPIFSRFFRKAALKKIESEVAIANCLRWKELP
jgi:hypothetical protein